MGYRDKDYKPREIVVGKKYNKVYTYSPAEKDVRLPIAECHPYDSQISCVQSLMKTK